MSPAKIAVLGLYVVLAVIAYLGAGGGDGLKAALAMSPTDVIAAIQSSGLRGRGGAGFPAGIKWRTVADTPGDEKYIVCNADEGDPGAYMDRSILEGNPHAVLEGMTIGAYAIGADRGYIYVRNEYPLALQHARRRPFARP